MAAGRNRQRQAQREAEKHQELIDALTAMNDNFKELSKANEALVAVIEKREATAKEEKDKADNMIKSLHQFTDKIPVFGKVFRKITSEIKQTFATSFKLQERALARGLNLDALRDQIAPLTDEMAGFTGGITDSLTALEIGTSMWESGLRSNNVAVGMLALQSKLTGGSHKKLLQQMAQTTAGLGMNDAQLSHLAKTTQGLSQNFHITGDQLVDAMAGLSSDLNELAALGIGAEIAEGTGVLAAALTPGMAHLAPDIMKALTSGSNMVQNAMLGGADAVRAVLEKGTPGTDTMNAIMTMGKRAQEVSDQYSKGALHSRFAMDQAVKVFGDQMPLYARAYTQIKDAADKQGKSIQAYTAALVKEQKIKDDFADTWENFKAKIFNPIKDIFMKVASWFMKSMMAWKPLAGILGVLVATVGVIGGIMVAMTALAGLPLIMKGISASFQMILAGIGRGFAAMGAQAGAGAPGIAAFAVGFVPVALAIAAVAASIGVAGAGLAALFHGWSPEGGGSTAAQSKATTRVASVNREADVTVGALKAQISQLEKLNTNLEENNQLTSDQLNSSRNTGQQLLNTQRSAQIKDFPYPQPLTI